MRRSFQIVFMMSLCLIGCQTKAPQSKEAAATASDPAAKQTKKPTRPAIGTATARQDCVYYTSTADGKMAISGSVKMGATVRVLQRSVDGWTDVRLVSGQEASIPTEDLTTITQFQRDRARARSARRGKFTDPRPKIGPGRYRGKTNKLPTAPPPPDFVPLPLPDSSSQDPLSDLPDIFLQGSERKED